MKNATVAITNMRYKYAEPTIFDRYFGSMRPMRPMKHTMYVSGLHTQYYYRKLYLRMKALYLVLNLYKLRIGFLTKLF